MAGEGTAVYGIGNPLIDVLIKVDDKVILELGLTKGTMALIDSARGNAILERFRHYEKTYSCGGSAPNTMITLSTLGVEATLAGLVGGDSLGIIYRERLAEKKVHSDLITGSGDTGTCIVLVTTDGERTMNTRLGVCQDFGPEHVKHGSIAASRYFYFTGYMWDTDSQKEAIRAAIATARRAGIKVAFDLADPFAVQRHRDDFLELIGSVDLLFANREEAHLLLGFDDTGRAAAELAKLCPLVAVKDSARGSVIAERGELLHTIAAFPVVAIDSTGAGDSYAAGFLAARIKGYPPRESGLLASYVAARVVQQTGAQLDRDCAGELMKEIESGDWLRV